MRARTRWTVCLGALALAACGAEVTGTFADSAGITRYAFSADGIVKIRVLGAEVDAEYRLDGNKILVSSAQGTVVLTRREDRLYGPMGLMLIRQQQ